MTSMSVSLRMCLPVNCVCSMPPTSNFTSVKCILTLPPDLVIPTQVCITFETIECVFLRVSSSWKAFSSSLGNSSNTIIPDAMEQPERVGREE